MSYPSSPQVRTLRARLAAFSKWAGEPDRAAATAPARAAFLARFEREVDPEGVLPEAERIRRGEYARKAHFSRLALKSAQRRARKGEGDGR